MLVIRGRSCFTEVGLNTLEMSGFVKYEEGLRLYAHDRNKGVCVCQLKLYFPFCLELYVNVHAADSWLCFVKKFRKDEADLI